MCKVPTHTTRLLSPTGAFIAKLKLYTVILMNIIYVNHNEHNEVNVTVTAYITSFSSSEEMNSWHHLCKYYNTLTHIAPLVLIALLVQNRPYLSYTVSHPLCFSSTCDIVFQVRRLVTLANLASFKNR